MTRLLLSVQHDKVWRYGTERRRKMTRRKGIERNSNTMTRKGMERSGNKMARKGLDPEREDNNNTEYTNTRKGMDRREA